MAARNTTAARTGGKGYAAWLRTVKSQIRRAQVKAAVRVNTELLRLYWDMGRDIAEKRLDAGYGSGFFERLSRDLKAEFPDMDGFSVSNLYNIKKFYLFYAAEIFHQPGGKSSEGILHQPGAKSESGNRHQAGDVIAEENLQQPVAKSSGANRQQVVDEFGTSFFAIPWRHHVEIFTHAESVKEALFYVAKTAENGWSRSVCREEMNREMNSAAKNAKDAKIGRCLK